jgi:phosphoribosylformylglycinamidine synthase subunit PurL
MPGRGEVTERAIAASSDCNGRYCYLDPYTGAQIAVAEAARNVACAGGRPAAITDCLNFGSPEKPEVFWTFLESIRGMADACRALGGAGHLRQRLLLQRVVRSADLPHAHGGPRRHPRERGAPHHARFKEAGDVVVLLGETEAELGGSEYLKVVHETVAGLPPRIDLDAEAALREVLLAGIGEGIVRSAHDCSEGGLAVALAESCIAGGIGADIHLGDELPPVAELFSETQGRVVVTVAEDAVERLFELAFEAAVPFAVIGTVGGEALRIEGLVDAGVAEMRDVFEARSPGSCIPRRRSRPRSCARGRGPVVTKSPVSVHSPQAARGTSARSTSWRRI